MHNDADFAAYMAARWPFLVRSLVLLGCPRHEAEAVARTGLARSYASWDRVLKSDDIDAYVYRSVLSCWRKSHKRRWWGDAPTAVLPEPLPDPDASDEVLLRRALEVELSRLTTEEREVLVLLYVAELTGPQVAEVLDVPVGTVRSRAASALAHIDLAALREVAGS